MDTMSITQPGEFTLACPFFMPVQRLDGGCGCILRACLWELGGMATVPPRATRAPSRPTRSCTNSAIWDMPRNVRACRSSAIAMPSASRLPAIKDHGCSCGLCARPAIALQSTARWNTTSSATSGSHRILTRASRRWWSVTFRPTCSVEFNPPRQTHRSERKTS